ncbi:hypothetical protein RF11_07498 [Thelohanellus kitauei]|uniref:Uncharacterized protein n=1 Tax=Thelohanellus kitauei TaxID=669202 RepID=A0A0C2MIX0_THEKT|nr:hypothetical protein RF11_07498 [Thelohanellus kitauei]
MYHFNLIVLRFSREKILPRIYTKQYLGSRLSPLYISFPRGYCRSNFRKLNRSIRFDVIFKSEWHDILWWVSRKHDLDGYHYFEVYCYAEKICSIGYYLVYDAIRIYSNIHSLIEARKTENQTSIDSIKEKTLGKIKDMVSLLKENNEVKSGVGGLLFPLLQRGVELELPKNNEISQSILQFMAEATETITSRSGMHIFHARGKRF